jgi:Ca2+-transporting ATPase
MPAIHALTAAEVLARLRVSGVTGLTDEEARARLKSYGPNTIVSRRKVSAVRVLLHQFQSPVVYLLAAAAVLAFYFAEWEEGGAIAIVLTLNALIGFLTELKAARSIEALRTLGSRSAPVRRDGHVRLIAAEQMVPGDIVVLEAGDAIPADLRLIEASNLAADESTLTGESVAVDKATHRVASDARLGERSSMLFKGTALTRGSGAGVVVATGLSTELGRVAQLVEEAEPGSSPLEKRLAPPTNPVVGGLGAKSMGASAGTRRSVRCLQNRSSSGLNRRRKHRQRKNELSRNHYRCQQPNRPRRLCQKLRSCAWSPLTYRIRFFA